MATSKEVVLWRKKGEDEGEMDSYLFSCVVFREAWLWLGSGGFWYGHGSLAVFENECLECDLWILMCVLTRWLPCCAQKIVARTQMRLATFAPRRIGQACLLGRWWSNVFDSLAPLRRRERELCMSILAQWQNG